ncbi:MAG TPA: hypothetical protein VMD98_10335 [Bryocella sp.]|nr:hypothetical protein [Bryocella sp.]
MRGWKRWVIVAIAVCAAVYLVDFVSLRIGIPRRPQLGNITVHTMYAVKLKNGKTEYDDGGDQVMNCSNSLLPQMGVSPCWYLSRHTDRQITVDSGYDGNPHLF